jgi:membrane protein YqaA with SNARE-associated domain
MTAMGAFFPALHDLTLPAIYAGTFAMGFVSGVLPFVINTELCLVGVAALSRAPAPAVVGCAVGGQMLAKYLLYLTGKGALNLRFVRRERRDTAARTFERHRHHSLALVGFSAVTGLPPFYGISLLAGAVGLPLTSFLVVGTIGRIVRFTVVYLAPGWLHIG